MSISYPISLPSSPAVQKIKLSAASKIGWYQSDVNYQGQVHDWLADYWMLECALPPMKRTTGEQWVAALTSLRGIMGTFYFGDPAAKTPRGIATGTPRAKGVQTAGNDTLVTDGWTTGQTGILLAGDYLQVGSGTSQRLYKVLADVDSDASGNANFSIFPRLRENIADNALLTVSNCKGVFRLATNQLDWDIDAFPIFGLSFKAMEAI